MRIKVQVVVEPDEEGAASVHEMTQLARGSSRTRVVQQYYRHPSAQILVNGVMAIQTYTHLTFPQSV